MGFGSSYFGGSVLSRCSRFSEFLGLIMRWLVDVSPSNLLEIYQGTKPSELPTQIKGFEMNYQAMSIYFFSFLKTEHNVVIYLDFEVCFG